MEDPEAVSRAREGVVTVSAERVTSPAPRFLQLPDQALISFFQGAARRAPPRPAAPTRARKRQPQAFIWFSSAAWP